LNGSLGELVDLSYQRATLGMAGTTLALAFLAAPQDGSGTVLEVDVDTSGLTVQPPMTINLTDVVTGNLQRGTVTRNIAGDPHQALPQLERGQLQLTGVSGSKASGSFAVTFVQGADFGCGRTAFGPYAAEVGQ
jgi:hypothetical protein